MLKVKRKTHFWIVVAAFLAFTATASAAGEQPALAAAQETAVSDEWDGATETFSVQDAVRACVSWEYLYKVCDVYGVSFGVCNNWDSNTRRGPDNGLDDQEGVHFNGRQLKHTSIDEDKGCAAFDGEYFITGTPGGIYDDSATEAVERIAVDRISYIEYEAKQNETFTLRSAEMKVLESKNGMLKFRVMKGGSGIYPENGWKTITSSDTGEAEAEIPKISVSLMKGDKLYFDFMSERIDKGTAEEVNGEATYVKFTYPMEVSLTERISRFSHSYRHSDKWRQDENGDTINETEFGETDEETYPFLYKYAITSGSDWGAAGSQQGALALCETKRPETWAKGALYGGATMTGFSGATTGGFAGIDGEKDVNMLALSFIAPYGGEIKISNMYIDYGVNYPNKTNGYNLYGETTFRQTFDGYSFYVAVNGVQVYPTDGWDRTLTRKYETETEGYAAGDLVRYQEVSGEIKGIFVEDEDEVSVVFTRTNKDNSRCDNCYFDVVFSLDADAEAGLTEKYLSSMNYFDLERGNYEGDILTYWAYDTSEGLYGAALNKQIFEDMDLANNTYVEYTDDMFAETAYIGANVFRPVENKDAVMVYTAPASGNLTLSAENLYRSGALSLYRYYDELYDLSPDEIAKVDGVRMRIEKNGRRIWPIEKSWENYIPDGKNRGVFGFEEITTGVAEGDEIAVRINCGEAGSVLFDELNFSPRFVLELTDTPMAGIWTGGELYTRLAADTEEEGNSYKIFYIAAYAAAGTIIAAGSAATAILCVRRKKANDEDK